MFRLHAVTLNMTKEEFCHADDRKHLRCFDSMLLRSTCHEKSFVIPSLSRNLFKMFRLHAVTLNMTKEEFCHADDRKHLRCFDSMLLRSTCQKKSFVIPRLSRNLFKMFRLHAVTLNMTRNELVERLNMRKGGLCHSELVEESI